MLGPIGALRSDLARLFAIDDLGTARGFPSPRRTESVTLGRLMASNQRGVTGGTGGVALGRPLSFLEPLHIVEASEAARRLIESASGGDRSALGQLYEAHAQMVYRVAYRLTESWADAQDIVQQVFLGLPEALRTFEGRGSFEGWLVQVTTRTVLMQLRQRNRSREVPYAAVSWIVGRVEPRHEIDRLALDEALGQLSPEQRAVLTLKFIEGYSHDEIGEILGINNQASRGRLFRAVRALRRLLS